MEPSCIKIGTILAQGKPIKKQAKILVKNNLSKIDYLCWPNKPGIISPVYKSKPWEIQLYPDLSRS